VPSNCGWRQALSAAARPSSCPSCCRCLFPPHAFPQQYSPSGGKEVHISGCLPSRCTLLDARIGTQSWRRAPALFCTHFEAPGASGGGGGNAAQVLLSQVHRARALALLGRFLDLGSWAVDLALSVGIFPYVLKLLQTSSADLRETLVFIWTKILALDRSCQVLLPLIRTGRGAGWTVSHDKEDALSLTWRPWSGAFNFKYRTAAAACQTRRFGADACSCEPSCKGNPPHMNTDLNTHTHTQMLFFGVQADLVKDNGARYFVDHLAAGEAAEWAPSRAQARRALRSFQRLQPLLDCLCPALRCADYHEGAKCPGWFCRCDGSV